MTRGRHSNHVLVVTDSPEISDARDLLERVITCDRADVPAMTRREQLAVNRAEAVRHTWFDGPDSAPTRSFGIEID
jgi:hypothetical protein